MGRYFNLEQETKLICRNAKAVTKSDTNFTEAFVPRGEATLYVGGAGDLHVRMAGDESDAVVIFKAVAAGSFLRIVVKAVLDATTATEILAIN
jgi:hypothetical protein|tara:strand:+ start:56 stop:334 length:279 start_codon:yes stop_codon:yes gene_type:complete